MKKSSFVLSLLVFSQATAFADRSWNEGNDPRNLDKRYNMNFSQLPPSGDVTASNRGWSDSYWPKTRGLIAERWQDPRYSGPFNFKKYPMVDARAIGNMTQDEINLLSPAEKFDIVRGKYTFPLATTLRKDDPDAKDWWRGLCNGWTHASVNIDEPQPIVFKNPRNNISVPLNTADIKGLMAYYYAYRSSADAAYVGKSCRSFGKILFDAGGACKDVNAGAFHVALLNEIGLKKLPLAIDRDPTVQVWNQPFVKYDMVVDQVVSPPSSKATKGTRKEVYVTTTAYFANELYKISDAEIGPGQTRETYEDDYHVNPIATPVLHTAMQEYGSKVYKYILELDSRDQIIGGDWLDSSDPHPDLIWKQDFKMPAMGYDKDNSRADDWSILSDIITQATAYAVPGSVAQPAAN